MKHTTKHTQKKKDLRSQIRWGIAGILVLFIASLAFILPKPFNQAIDVVNNTTHIGIPKVPERSFRLGLDLQSGVHLIYSADIKTVPLEERRGAVEGARDVIERRINSFGVAEPNIQTTKVGDDYRILVELPGVTDVSEATALIGETPILEFKEPNNEPPRELTPEEEASIVAFNQNVKTTVDQAVQEIKQGAVFETLAAKYSEDENAINNNGYLGFVKKYGSEDPVIYEWASEVSEGEVTQSPLETEDHYYLLKRGKQQDGQVEVTASHILICYFGAPGCNAITTKEQALEQAEQIYAQANAKNFAELAKEHSSDTSNKDVGGEIGTFPRGVMIEPFEEAVFAAKAGEIFGPVETPFGYHIVYKTEEQTTQEYEVWKIQFEKQTKEDIIPPQDSWKNTELSGKQLQRAEVITDPQTGEVQVSLRFNSEGAALFEELTRKNVGKQIAIFLDGSEISSPVVNQVISGGQAVISGNFSIPEARLLTQRLNAGALPVPVTLISQQSIGASLGAASLQKSLFAGQIAVLLIFIFMIVYYRLPGLLSVFSMTLYISLTLALFKLIGVTLTLSGITGFILSIGIAIDANILIFERMKEELHSGKSLKQSIEEGFLRAWSSIRDGNLSTLITCVLLIWFGSSFVKGFAITLTIGILVSLFTAITITRVLLRFIAPWFEQRGYRLFLGRKAPKHHSSN